MASNQISRCQVFPDRRQVNFEVNYNNCSIRGGVLQIYPDGTLYFGLIARSEDGNDTWHIKFAFLDDTGTPNNPNYYTVDTSPHGDGDVNHLGYQYGMDKPKQDYPYNGYLDHSIYSANYSGIVAVSIEYDC